MIAVDTPFTFVIAHGHSMYLFHSTRYFTSIDLLSSSYHKSSSKISHVSTEMPTNAWGDARKAKVAAARARMKAKKKEYRHELGLMKEQDAREEDTAAYLKWTTSAAAQQSADETQDHANDDRLSTERLWGPAERKSSAADPEAHPSTSTSDQHLSTLHEKPTMDVGAELGSLLPGIELYMSETAEHDPVPLPTSTISEPARFSCTEAPGDVKPEPA